MKAKLKLCAGCDQQKLIWKNDEGSRYCQPCWLRKQTVTGKRNKPTNTKPIARRSSKRIKEDKEYSVLRAKFLLSSPLCTASLPNICTHHATDIHHTHAGSNRSEHFLNVSTWLGLCRPCHTWIHEHPAEARGLNLLK